MSNCVVVGEWREWAKYLGNTYVMGFRALAFTNDLTQGKQEV